MLKPDGVPGKYQLASFLLWLNVFCEHALYAEEWGDDGMYAAAANDANFLKIMIQQLRKRYNKSWGARQACIKRLKDQMFEAWVGNSESDSLQEEAAAVPRVAESEPPEELEGEPGEENHH